MIQSLDYIMRQCMLHAKAKAQDTVPIDTGNMRYASFKVEALKDGEYRAYFNMEGKHTKGQMDGIAPYAKWTNERNCSVQGWFDDKTVERFMEAFEEALRLNGLEIVEIKRNNGGS